MNRDKLVLSIETSQKLGSLSVFVGENEIGNWQGNETVSRSEDLVLGIQQIFEKNKIDKQNLQLMIVSLGPGSFTGLRVGIAIGKGLALALNCPLIGVSVLEALAFYYACQSQKPTSKVVCVVGAGRGFVYYQIFNVQNKLIEADSAIKLDTMTALTDELLNQSETIIISVENLETELINLKNIGSEIISIKEHLSKYVGLYAFSRNKVGEIGNQSVSPIYIREV